MAWVKRDEITKNVAIFAHDYPSIFFGFHNSLYKWSFRTATGGVLDCYSGYSPPETWVHITGTYDGSTAVLYVNGQEICVKNTNGPIIMESNNAPYSSFTISGFYDKRTVTWTDWNGSGITDEIDGMVDEVKVYNKALSGAEVRNFYDLGKLTGNPNISDCPPNKIVAQYRIDNGPWQNGYDINVSEGSEVYIRAQTIGEYFVTTQQYGGPTFSSVTNFPSFEDPTSYKIDTFVNPLGNPERNNGLVDASNEGKFVLTTSDGCMAVISLTVEDPVCPPGSITPEYTVDGVTGSGIGILSVTEGQPVSLTTVQGGTFDISPPNGLAVPGPLDLGAVSSADAGTYLFTSPEGCTATLDLQINDPNSCAPGSIVPEYNLDGTWLSGDNDLNVAVGTNVVLSMLPNGIGLTITLPDGTLVGDNFSLGAVDESDSGAYLLTSAEGCQTTINLTVGGGTACPVLGTPCDDGDPNTENDVEDGNCNCSGAPIGSSDTVCVSIESGGDDMEQNGTNGSMYSTSSDIELVSDVNNGGGNQTIGLRFNNIGMPQGATISGAYLQFTVDEVGSGPSSLAIQGEAADNATAYSAAAYDVSNRARTTASVSWAPPAWNTVGSSGAAQTSPDLSSIVQEIVDRPGYGINNSISFVITGSGKRTAESYEGAPASAAQLCITYSTGSASKEGLSGTFKALENLVITDNTTGTKVLDNNIMTFPNPTSGIVQINMVNYMGAPVELNVFNSVQQSVLTKKFAGDHRAEEEIDLTGLSSGQYYFIFTGAPGKVVKTVILAN